MTEQKRGLSLGQIILLWALALGASIAASWLVQRFVLDKPDPKIHVAVLVGATIPVLFLLARRRRRPG